MGSPMRISGDANGRNRNGASQRNAVPSFTGGATSAIGMRHGSWIIGMNTDVYV